MPKGFSPPPPPASGSHRSAVDGGRLRSRERGPDDPALMRRLAGILDIWNARRDGLGFEDRNPWHPLSLRFEPALERDYLLDRTADFAPLPRLTLLMGMPLLLAYLLHDANGARQFAHALVYLQVLLLMLPASLALLGALARQAWLPAASALAWVAAGINALVSANVLVMLQAFGHAPPQLALLLPLQAALLLMSLPFRLAVPLSFGTFTLYVGGMLVVGTPASFSEDVALMGYALAFGALACRAVEQRHRRNWIDRRGLLDRSRRDALTGLFDSVHFRERFEATIERACRESKTVALLALDIDTFKQFNDRYGHPVGDEALRRVAAVIDEFANGPHDFAGRIGGEEFALLRYGVSGRQALEQANELRERIERLRVDFLDYGGLKLTVSVGVVTADGMLAQPDLLQSLADDALYRAKRAGRNTVRGADSPRR